MENSWSFSGRDSFSDRFSGGKYHTESDLENGMETENPGFFLSDPEFCGERYFRRSIFAGSVTTQGSTLSFSVFLWVYHIWGTAVSGLYADSWDGDRTYPDFMWSIFRCIFILLVLYTDSPMISGKTMGLYLRNRGYISGREWLHFWCIQGEFLRKVSWIRGFLRKL